MQELDSLQIHRLMQRFPCIELSYETHPHKKVSCDYNVCIAIPVGKKCFAWFTFYGEKNVCFFIELNRDKKASKITVSYMNYSSELSKGTILYGTMVEDSVFLVDDIYYFCGTPIRNLLFSEKLGFLYTFFNDLYKFSEDICISLPMMWPIYEKNDYECIYNIGYNTSEIPYTIHHVQYRCLNFSGPFYNVLPSKKFSGPTSFGSSASGIISTVNDKTMIYEYKMNPRIRMDTSKAQYKNFTVFLVCADMQFDVYHLFAYGRNKELVYCGVSYIANYKTSIFMNSIFRKIRENENIDAIEESDDEEDFQNTDYDKYVDLEKKVQIECRYNMRFKKWEPVRKLDGSHKTVHISQLASHY